MRILAIALCALIGCGCSATQETARSAAEATTYLNSVETATKSIQKEVSKPSSNLDTIKDEAEDIITLASLEPPDVENIIKSADTILFEVKVGTPDPKIIGDAAEDILNLTSNAKEELQDIQEQIPKMEDKVPYWMELLYLLGIVGLLAIVWFLLERTGAILVIKKFFWGLGLMLPSEAKVEAKILTEKPKDEVIQYFRTKYPDINAAIDKKERKAGSISGSQSSSGPSPPDSPQSTASTDGSSQGPSG